MRIRNLVLVATVLALVATPALAGGPDIDIQNVNINKSKSWDSNVNNNDADVSVWNKVENKDFNSNWQSQGQSLWLDQSTDFYNNYYYPYPVWYGEKG